MKREVKLKIKGTQGIGTPEQDSTTISVSGHMMESGDLKTILYQEYPEEEPSRVTRNILKIREDSVEITKKGVTNSRLHFRVGKDTESVYETPFGTFHMKTKNVDLKHRHTQEKIHVQLMYDLEMNEAYVSHCQVEIVVKEA
ncbi:MAG: DUF1934 domain-containing protein [Eubacterium sp.]|nr:DUF1934 domain-containing protein [Eubacterium sp.]